MTSPVGFGVVTPYIFAKKAVEYVEFLKLAFGASELGRSLSPDGHIANCQLRFHNCVVMISEKQALNIHQALRPFICLSLTLTRR